MVHHSLTEDGSTVSWQAIRAYHKITQGWQDIGYHYGVELVGNEYEVFVGRPESEVAAACKEGKMNEKAIHVCCVGNFDLASPPKQLVDKLIDYVVLPVLRRYKIGWGNVIAHRDYAHYKSCPGRQFNMDTLRSAIAARF